MLLNKKKRNVWELNNYKKFLHLILTVPKKMKLLKSSKTTMEFLMKVYIYIYINVLS